MIRRVVELIALLTLAMAVTPASATTVAVNTDSAKAVLEALQNPGLTHDASLKIAAMPGNQGIIRKLVEFKLAANTQGFADALYDCAHGVKATSSMEEAYSFDSVKPRIPQLKTLLKEIATNPAEFQGKIEKRIAMFAPAGTDLKLQGYVVAGGDGGGYTFGGTDFYLNLGMTDEYVVAIGVTTHELYHAVQGAFAKDRGAVEDLPSLDGMTPTQQSCVKSAQLLANLYEEGTAMYVEDISLLQSAHSELGQRMQTDARDGIRHVHASVSLLEMSVISLGSAEPMSFDDVYDVGFYGHGILYNVGYVMAKAIADQDGAQGLAAHLKLPSTQFLLHYTELPKYGKDKDHPTLGPNTVAAARRVIAGCGPAH
ncbi:hypothetical protein HDF16_002058 [Granulicella aggregans]|uniref:Uncharacterized protein n=1 Tax=Granulicella aggregans TaxID=474949 RepID=A0A7W7ZCT1_9BACT|nr:DUF5700 domain-containing putative Zn-dependent protease [Granulicella aggregans]MBB5057373.1 hypothetical protein [Granulicella aggregans]